MSFSFGFSGDDIAEDEEERDYEGESHDEPTDRHQQQPERSANNNNNYYYHYSNNSGAGDVSSSLPSLLLKPKLHSLDELVIL